MLYKVSKEITYLLQKWTTWYILLLPLALYEYDKIEIAKIEKMRLSFAKEKKKIDLTKNRQEMAR